MRDLGLGQIILLIVLILVPLIKFVMQRVGRRPSGQMPSDNSSTDIPRGRRITSTPTSPPRTSRNQVRASEELPVSTLPSRSRFTKRSMLATRGDVRRGIIMMTILRPCRAFDPLD